MTATIDQLLKVCREVLAPLIRADGGEIYIVAVEANHLSIHLAGKFAGCPGTPLTVRGIISDGEARHLLRDQDPGGCVSS